MAYLPTRRCYSENAVDFFCDVRVVIGIWTQRDAVQHLGFPEADCRTASGQSLHQGWKVGRLLNIETTCGECGIVGC
jgi:hypothetical protein